MLPLQGDLLLLVEALALLDTGACFLDECPVGGREGWLSKGVGTCDWGKVDVGKVDVGKVDVEAR